MQQSLERRLSEENISEARSAYIKRTKQKAFGQTADISFSSNSSDFYYDTTKSNKKKEEASAQRQSRPLRYRRSASKKSMGRKSYDDVMVLLNKSASKPRSLSKKGKSPS